MGINRAKEKMINGQPALGAVLGMGCPGVAGYIAAAGFDFVLIDMQHGRWNRDSAHDAFRLIFRNGSVPMVRVEQNDPFAIGSMLDRGALGVVVPMVETKGEAEAVVAAARYGPQGKRSVGGGPLRDFLGLRNDETNNEIFVAVQIETVLGVENAEEILGVSGVDGCWVGPSDLELSMNVDLRDERGCQRHREAIKTVIETSKRLDKVPGIATPGPNGEWLDEGCTFVTVGSDGSVIGRGARSILGSYERYRLE